MRMVIFLLVFLLSCKTKHYTPAVQNVKPVFSSIYNNLGSSGVSASLGYGRFLAQKHNPTPSPAQTSPQHKPSFYISNLQATENELLIPETKELTIQVDTPPKQNAHQDTLFKAQNETYQPTETFGKPRCGMPQLVLMIGLIILLLGSLFAFLFWISKALALKIIFGFVGGILLLFGLLIVIRFFLDLFI